MKVIIIFLMLGIILISSSCDENANIISQDDDSTSQTSSSFYDPYESNDTSANASNINPNVRYKGVISSSGDEDWFIITIRSQFLSAEVELKPPAGSNYDLEVYDSGLALYGSSANSSDNVENVTLAVGGTYYIRVFSSGDSNGDDPYTLRAW